MDEKQLQGYIDWAKNGKLLGEDAANYFKLSGLSGSDFDLAMSQMPTEYEISQPTPDLAPEPQEQKKEEVDPFAGFVPMKQDEGRGQFDIDLGFIEGSILEKSEEEAVGILRNKYNRYGFEFSEAVPGFDYINVKAPNGEEQKFVFGRELFESEKQYYPNHEKSLAAGAQDLVSFMNANMIEDVDKINDLAKANFLDTPGYMSKEDIQKDQKALEARVESLQSEITAYQELADSYNSVLLSGNQEEADRIASEVRDMSKDLENKRAELEQDNRTFEANYGRWFSTKSNQGTWIGAAMNWLGEGFDNIVNGYVNEFMDAPYFRGTSMADLMAGKVLSDEERLARKIDYKGFEEIVKRFSGTTDEYVEHLERKIQAIPNPMTRMTFQGVEGLIKSAPAFLSPGKWLRMANMTAIVLNDLSEEMSGEEFEGVTEDEKWLLKAPMAITTAVLEEIGFRNATQVKAFAPRILGRVLGKTKAGSKLAPKTLAEYIEQDVKNSIARGGLTLGAAFLAEAETGALQEVADIELKRLWDLAKDRTDFDAPSTTSEYFSRVASAAYMEGVGGFVLGSRSAYRSAKNPFKDGDLADMMILSSEDVVEAREIFRKREVALGKMSKADAQEQNRIERKIHEVAKQVPADASVSVQKQIFRKLQKEAGLKDAVAKKGARMAAREQSELNQVRKELEDIANNYDRMTPEQKAKEMREITQPITPTGGVFVETADGSTIEIAAEDVSPQEQQQNDSMEEGPELQEGVQLSLFDETSDQPTQDTPEPVQEEADPSDFAEVEVSELSPQAMQEAGFSTEYQSLIGKVQQAVGGDLSRGEGDKIFNHKTSASILQAVKRVAPGRSRELRFGQFVMGFVHIPQDGGPQEIHLLDTNSSDFTEQVKEAAKTLGRSYNIASAVDLVAEELVTHYMLQDMFGRNGTSREDFYNELDKLSESNPKLKQLIDRTKAEYNVEQYGKAKQEEEVIAAFFKDYIKSPSTYRNIWQRIADWFNNTFRKGTRVINSESDLMSVARNVSNIMSGVSVDVQTSRTQPVDAGTSFATTSGSNYLVDETVYYKLNRNAGVEYAYWADPPPPVAQKIKVRDYFHFRNWYNKMTANQKLPQTITGMYFVRDGKKHTIKPPKPKRDRQGNLVEMDRVVKTDKQIREEKRAYQDRLNREEKIQYRALVKEVMDMWAGSRFKDVTYPLGFVPDGGPQDLDFEGYIIAKKNLKALIESDLTPEDLKERKGLRYELDKYNDPDIFNMTESFRVEDQEPGTVIDIDGLGLSFNVTSGEVVSNSVGGSFNGIEIIDPATAPKTGLAMNYDPAGATEVTMTYGDKIYKFNTNGGIPGIQSTGKPNASISHGKDAEREKMLRLLRYYHLIHTSSEEVLRGFIESETERGQYTADVDETLEKALKIKKQLELDNGRVTAVFHLSELRTLTGRQSFATQLINMIMDSIDIENNPTYTKRVLRDIAGPFREMLSDEAYEFYVKLLNGGMEVDFTNLDHVRKFAQNLPQLSSFRRRQDALGSLPMFQSDSVLYSGKRPKIYSKFPSLTERRGEEIWKQMVDPYVWSKMSEELMHSRVKTAGQALGGVIINLNDLFSGENGEPIKFEAPGSDFPFYLGGGEKVVYFSKKVFLDRKTTAERKAQGEKKGTVEVFSSELLNKGHDEALMKERLEIRKQMVAQAAASSQKQRSTGKPLKKTMERYVANILTTPATIEARKMSMKGDPMMGYAGRMDKTRRKGEGEFSAGSQEFFGPAFAIASGRLSSKVAENSGSKGVSVNQLLQVAGKASKAERAVLNALIKKFPGQDFIPKEELDMFFEGKMLQPLEEERNHANYGLDRLLGRSYRMADAVTVPFLGDEEIYGTAGIFEDHFGFPVHAHIRMFTHPNDPGIRYVSEIQSDTYQKGLDEAYDGTITDEVMIEDAGSDELGITVQNLEFLKYIVDNYEQYRTTLIVAARGEDNAMNDKFWDDLLQEAEVVPEDRINDAPNVDALLSNAVNNNPDFNVRAFRAVLKYYALSNLNAPIGSTDKQIESIIDEAFNKYPFVQEGEKSNLDRFTRDLIVTIDYTTMSISSLVVGEDMQYMSQEERLEAYKEVVDTVEKNKQKKETEKVEGIPSAEKSWEKQLIRYAVRQAQENGEAVVRFPTEKTAADIQWWDASDAELQEYMDQEFGIDGMREMPDEFESEEREKQRPLRKRYRDLPKTLKSVGLESRVIRDQNGNAWYEVDVPPTDHRMIMFSITGGRDNLGEIGGSTWEARQRTGAEEWTDLWLTRLQDRYRKVFQLQEDVAKKTEGQVKKDEDFRMAEELMYGKAANDLEGLENMTVKITELLRDNSLTIEELDRYMYALHAGERNAVIRERTEGKNQMGSGLTDEEAQRVLSEISPDKKQQLEQVASIVREILADTRSAMVSLGLESQETIDAFEDMFKNYVPLQGKSVDEDDMAYSPYPNGGTGFSVSGATTKKAKGRFSESSNIVAQAIAQNAAVRIKGRTNEAMNALYNLAINNPNPNIWQVLDKEQDGYKSDDPNIVSVRVDGVQKAIRFRDASYAQSLRKMNMPQTNYFVKAMGSINSWLRAAFTSRNPEFILSNFSRDIQSAIFNASAETEIEGGFLNGTAAMKRIFKLVGPSLKTLVRDEVGKDPDPMIMRYYEEFKADGGKTGWAYQKSLEDIASDLTIDDSGKTAGQKVIGGVKGALEFVEGMNDAFENSIRLSAYIAAREGGVTREKAAQFAKNITVNFNKQGEWGAAVNATYLFFNASVQGTARLGRSLVKMKPPVKPDGSRREWYERATTAQKAALGMVIMNALLTLLNRAASDEDEDGILFYNKIPDYVKERNMIIMRPDGENYWKIPMPYGYNIFANIGTTSVEVASGDKEAMEGLAFMAMSIVNAFSPVSFGQSEGLATQVAKTSIPTAFKPFFEAFAFNETYFGGPVKAEQYPFGTPKPNSSMSFRSPEEIKQFFSWMNEATGGSEDVPGVIDINPDGGWYIFEYFLGGTGRFVTRSIETGRKIAADRPENPIDLDFNDIPFARIVYGEPSKYYDMQKFKDHEVEVKQLVSEYKNNRISNAGDRYNGIFQLESELKKVNKALKAVRAEKRRVKKIRDYGERVSKIQALMDRERKLVMIFNEKYEKLRGQD